MARLPVFTIATTYLTKLSNLPLLTVAIIAIVAKWRQILRQQPGVATLALIPTVLCAGVPIGGWMLWSKFHFGDVVGSTTAITLLLPGHRNLSPIGGAVHFSPQGLWTFWYELLARFWRGELMWQNRELGWHVADEFYAISSLLLICAAMIGIRQNSALSTFQRQALFFAALTFMAALAFLALLSIRFDFGECIYPSRAHPYFTSGRLMAAT